MDVSTEASLYMTQWRACWRLLAVAAGMYVSAEGVPPAVPLLMTVEVVVVVAVPPVVPLLMGVEVGSAEVEADWLTVPEPIVEAWESV